MLQPSFPQEKTKIASEMTDLLLSDHGFVEFFAFLKTTNLSVDDAFEMFSRLTLTRSSRYSTYLVDNEFIEGFSNFPHRITWKLLE